MHKVKSKKKYNINLKTSKINSDIEGGAVYIDHLVARHRKGYKLPTNRPYAHVFN